MPADADREAEPDRGEREVAGAGEPVDARGPGQARNGARRRHGAARRATRPAAHAARTSRPASRSAAAVRPRTALTRPPPAPRAEAGARATTQRRAASGITSLYSGPSSRPADVHVRDRRLEEPERRRRPRRPSSGEPKPHDERGRQALDAEQRAGLDRDGRARRGRDRGHRGDARPPGRRRAARAGRRGTPTTRAPTRRPAAIACSPRPDRVRSIASADERARGRAPPRRRRAPGPAGSPRRRRRSRSRRRRRNGIGSGKTYAEPREHGLERARGSRTRARRSPPTQPSVEPRARYGWIDEQVAARADRDADERRRRRARARTARSSTFVCVTGPCPAATSSVVNTPRPTRSPSAR